MNENLVIWVLIVAVAVAWCWIVWGKIFEKAGYSRWRSLVMVLPVINWVALAAFAFTDWPALEKPSDSELPQDQ